MASIEEAKQLVGKVHIASLEFESLLEKYTKKMTDNIGNNELHNIEITQLKKSIDDLKLQKNNTKSRIDKLINTIQETIQNKL